MHISSTTYRTDKVEHEQDVLDQRNATAHSHDDGVCGVVASEIDEEDAKFENAFANKSGFFD